MNFIVNNLINIMGAHSFNYNHIPQKLVIINFYVGSISNIKIKIKILYRLFQITSQLLRYSSAKTSVYVKCM